MTYKEIILASVEKRNQYMMMNREIPPNTVFLPVSFRPILIDARHSIGGHLTIEEKDTLYLFGARVIWCLDDSIIEFITIES